MRLLLFLFTFAFIYNAQAQKPRDTFSVYFDLDVPELNDRAKSKLDSLLYRNRISRDKSLAIIGYADYLATEEYNLELSEKRARNVKKHLVAAGFDPKKIITIMGKGEVKRKDTIPGTVGVARDRRVDIAVIDNTKPKPVRDTTIVMRPREKAAIPPSSDDPDFDIEKIPEGKSFILKNIYFPMGRHFPKQTSYEELNMLLDAMKENPRMVIRIEGHVCCIYNVEDAYDLDSRKMDLSVNRARFIYEYLKARGISEHRLSYVGYGKSRPIFADEQTAEEAAQNRRVEIRIMQK